MLLLGLKKNLNSDLLWNFISLAFLGLSGILLNLIISLYYEPDILGAFNQVLSIYIVFSMIGSGGFNYSVLRAIAINSKNINEIENIICGALLPVVFLSLLTTLILFFLIDPISLWLKSELVYIGLQSILPGLFFFSINKVLLNGVLNGFQKFKKYAFYQSLRYLIILFGLLIAIVFSFEGGKLPFIFSLSEIFLFIFLFIEVSIISRWWRSNNFYYWLKKHFSYGIKGLSSGILIELNSKIDIIFIGYFLSDRLVGIYSFAALFAEGFLQFLIIFQNLYNPIIAKFLFQKNYKDLSYFVKTRRKKIYKYTFSLFFLILIIYRLLMEYITNDISYLQSLLPFAILIIGITLASGYIPYYNIFFMDNKPFWQSLFMILIVLSNIFLNIFLIPIFNINGAATATALSFLLSILFLKILSRKIINLKL
tara:strand:+ start:379 stop:1653 length:1275 start_codon:yes stop_codon:yes gene_type:complete